MLSFSSLNAGPTAFATSSMSPNAPTIGVGNIGVPSVSLYRLALPLTTGTSKAIAASRIPAIDS